jgi:cyclophilin family peptidyl-prolyl cis-trans isomerase
MAKFLHCLRFAVSLSIVALVVGCNRSLPTEESNKTKDAVKAAETPVAKPETEKGEDAVTAIETFIAESKIDRDSEGWRMKLPKPPKVDFPAGKEWYWKMETNKGAILIKLLPEVAPMHVSSTIYLVLLGYYDGLVFHRVITDFMAQGGCPMGRGTGGPGYQYAGEFSSQVRHDTPGLLSMANAGPGTDGSQFFLTFKPTPWLDGKHTIFGRVVEGMDVVKELEKCGSRTGRTSEKLVMQRSSIEAVPKPKTESTQE